MEVIEHVDPSRLGALEAHRLRVRMPPRTVIVTTPNVEHNVRFETLPDWIALRHRDHRFEWTRAQFRSVGRDGRRHERTATPCVYPAGR